MSPLISCSAVLSNRGINISWAPSTHFSLFWVANYGYCPGGGPVKEEFDSHHPGVHFVPSYRCIDGGANPESPLGFGRSFESSSVPNLFQLTFQKVAEEFEVIPSFDVFFAPSFSNKNDQNRPNQKPRAIKPISIAYSKALTSIFWLLKRVFIFIYRQSQTNTLYTSRVSKNRLIFCQVSMDSPPSAEPVWRPWYQYSGCWIDSLIFVDRQSQSQSQTKTDITFTKFWWIFIPFSE